MARKAKAKGLHEKPQIRSRKGVGKAQKRVEASTPTPPVKLYLLITRASGDVEKHPLGEVPNLLSAYDYKSKLMKVALPKKVRKASDGYKGRLVYGTR